MECGSGGGGGPTSYLLLHYCHCLANYPSSPLKLLQTLCSLILKFIPALYVTVQAVMIMIIVYNEIKCVIVFLPIKAHSITVLMERQMARAGCRQ